MKMVSPTRRLTAVCALLTCGLCGAFMATTPIYTTSYGRDRSLPSASGRSIRYVHATRIIRMQGNDDELQTAVRTLASQVEDLTAIVKQLVTDTGTGGGGSLSSSHNINGAEMVNSSAVSTAVATKEPKELVSTAAAQQRIDQWLRELDGKEPSTPAASVAAVAVRQPAPATSVPVTPEVEATSIEATPVEAPPAAGAPAGSGYKVKIEWEGAIHEVTCDAETTVLEAAMDAGLELPHSCMSGSCLTCPGKLVSGSVDQSEGVLEDDQTEAGYMLTCVSYPKSDLHFTVIEEDDLP